MSAASATAGTRTRRPFGVSVVICCHNSARLLPQTLQHVARQQTNADLPWELLIVDNCSTDGTGEAAIALWPRGHGAPIRVTREPLLGQTFARVRGLGEASFEVVTFVDDDNRVSSEWVQTAAEVMAAHPEVAVCGGVSTDVYEVSRPAWWRDLFGDSMVGTDPSFTGDMTDTIRTVQGAGITIRASAYEAMRVRGFEHLSVGRQGKSLSGADDFELCYALNLAGWRLYVEPRMRLEHFITAPRLNWDYVRRLQRGNAVSRLQVEPYEDVLNARGRTPGRSQWRGKMIALAAALARTVARHPLKTIGVASSRCPEGDLDALRIEGYLARARALIAARNTYDAAVAAIAAAPWRA